MKTEEIKSRLKKKKITQKRLAQSLGIKQQSVSQVIRRLHTSEPVQKLICVMLNKEFDEVWGG